MDNLENIDVSNMDVSTMSKVIERLWPKFLDAGMNIVWAVLILIVGLKLISILRKFLKKTLLRGNVDTGVVQFLDALVKISAWTVLILSHAWTILAFRLPLLLRFLDRQELLSVFLFREASQTSQVAF